MDSDNWTAADSDRWTVSSGDCVQDGDGPGTVTAVPSRLAAAWSDDLRGWVDVRWDAGGEDYYCIGSSDQYELDFV